MARKFQLPVIGGIRKVLTQAQAATGTTIAEIGDNTVTLAQLATLLGITASGGGGGAGTAFLSPGPGLSGGGPLIGNVGLYLTAPIPSRKEGPEGERGRVVPGQPGQRGLPGVTVFMRGQDGNDGRPIPGLPGAPGVQGLPGATHRGPEGESSYRYLASFLNPSGVIPGSYTSANITVDVYGRVTAAANGSGGGGTPGGANTDVQFNNSGAFGGSANLTWDGTTLRVTSAARPIISNSTTARGGGNNWLEFDDPTGAKGYVGYGLANDSMQLQNQLNASLLLGTNNATMITIAAAGNVSIAAPSSGSHLVSGASGNFTIEFAADTGANNSFGPLILAGTSSSDQSLTVNNAANSLNYLVVRGDGACIMGAPTGSFKTIGTLNAQGLFVNGVSVYPMLQVFKAALTNRASNVTPSNDPDLVLTLAASATYIIEASVGAFNSAGATVGIKCNLNYSGTFNAANCPVGITSTVFAAAGAPMGSTPSVVIASGNIGAASGAPCMILCKATITTGTSGTLGFAWSQNNTNVTATTVVAGSYLIAIRIA